VQWAAAYYIKQLYITWKASFNAVPGRGFPRDSRLTAPPTTVRKSISSRRPQISAITALRLRPDAARLPIRLRREVALTLANAGPCWQRLRGVEPPDKRSPIRQISNSASAVCQFLPTTFAKRISGARNFPRSALHIRRRASLPRNHEDTHAESLHRSNCQLSRAAHGTGVRRTF